MCILQHFLKRNITKDLWSIFKRSPGWSWKLELAIGWEIRHKNCLLNKGFKGIVTHTNTHTQTSFIYEFTPQMAPTSCAVFNFFRDSPVFQWPKHLGSPPTVLPGHWQGDGSEVEQQGFHSRRLLYQLCHRPHPFWHLDFWISGSSLALGMSPKVFQHILI